VHHLHALDRAPKIEKMSDKKRKSAAPSSPKFLLIITGDGTDKYVCDANNPSVDAVKAAINEAKQCKLKREKKAGLGMLAILLRERLMCSAEKTIKKCTAKDIYSETFYGDGPVWTEGVDTDFSFDINAIIDVLEHSKWTPVVDDQFEGDFTQLYEVCILRDCC
jgi:hypothetical protein